MLICGGETVRLELLDGGANYFLLDAEEEIVDGQLVPGCNNNFLFVYGVDPLTSECQSCLCSFRYAYVISIQLISRLPINEDYEIDSIERFFDKHLVNYFSWDMPEKLAVKSQFWNSFHIFLIANRTLLLARELKPESPLRKSDFTELGLDFMRQHYRFVKAVSIRKETAPSRERLQQLLTITKANRTTDADWTKPDIGPWIARETEA